MNKFLQILINANIPEQKIQNILSKGKLRSIKNQNTLVHTDTICRNLYFVLKGGFVCRYIDNDLKIERTINFYLEDFHPFMSCIDSYFSEKQTRCEIRAIANSEVLEFSKSDIDELIQHDKDLFQFYNSILTIALVEENDFKLKLISYTSIRLYNYLIRECPIIIQKVPSKYIAEFMAISPEWLSKIKHRI